MNVVNCRRCGKLFNYIAGSKICPMCKEEIEQKFQEVKKYIQQNGRCDMMEVCEACDVDSAQIQTWIRQERLQFSDDSPIKVACEGCGKMIGSGKYYPQCRDKLAKNLNSMMTKNVTELKNEPHKTIDAKSRMRFLTD